MARIKSPKDTVIGTEYHYGELNIPGTVVEYIIYSDKDERDVHISKWITKWNKKLNRKGNCVSGFIGKWRIMREEAVDRGKQSNESFYEIKSEA